MPNEKSEKKTPAKETKQDDGKLAQFLKQAKLDPRRVLAASYKIERFRPEDRTIRLNKRKAKAAEGENVPKETRKPRTGRPVTQRAMNAALAGAAVSGPTKSRILRAVNHLLEQKKKEKVELKALFG
jgi:hypothetical protein